MFPSVSAFPGSCPGAGRRLEWKGIKEFAVWVVQIWAVTKPQFVKLWGGKPFFFLIQSCMHSGIMSWSATCQQWIRSNRWQESAKGARPLYMSFPSLSLSLPLSLPPPMPAGFQCRDRSFFPVPKLMPFKELVRLGWGPHEISRGLGQPWEYRLLSAAMSGRGWL